MFNLIASSGTIVNPQITQGVHDALLNVLYLILMGTSTAAMMGIKLWINSMNSGWKKALAERLVKYAEQKIAGNDAKLQYVSDKMHEHFPRLSSEEIHHLLEEAVANLQATQPITVTVDAPAPVVVSAPEAPKAG